VQKIANLFIRDILPCLLKKKDIAHDQSSDS